MTESFGAYPAEQVSVPVESGPALPFSSPNAAPSLLRPPPLRIGDTVGVVAPSYAPHSGWLLRGARALHTAGYKVVLEPEIRRARLFTQHPPRKRARNLTEMCAFPEVKPAVCGTVVLRAVTDKSY